MWYIKQGKIVDAAGRRISVRPELTAAEIQRLEFVFLNDANAPVALDPAAEYQLAADTDFDLGTPPVCVAAGVVASDRTGVAFELDTYTEEFFAKVHPPCSVVMLELAVRPTGAARSSRIALLEAVAGARVYVEGRTPPPTPAKTYATTDYVDEKTEAVKSELEPKIDAVKVDTATILALIGAAVEELEGQLNGDA